MSTGGIQQARREIIAALGKQQMAELHRQNPLIDGLAVAVIYAIIAGCFAALVTLPVSAWWACCLVLQGFAFQLLALLFHDAFLHRRAGGERVRWLMSCLLTLPLLISPTSYEVFHLAHHRHVGTDLDTEEFKQRVDTRLKRLALTTLPGFLVQRRWPVDEGALTPVQKAKIRVERRLIALVAAAFVAATCAWPRAMGLGLFLPLFTTFPVAVVLRIILEHAEADPENPFHVAIFYRTGALTRPLFLWDCGDCHLVHHLFANIPFYRISRAISLMRPLLLSRGVPERTSLLRVLAGYYLENFPHRSRWPR